MSRKETRKKFAELLKGPLSGLVDADQILNGRPADFHGALKVVCVYSSGTSWAYVSRATSSRDFSVTVDTFVKYADQELNWTEAEAEDLLDDISDIVLDVVDANQAVSGHWSGLSVIELTQTGDTVDVNGTEYRRETITIIVS